MIVCHCKGVSDRAIRKAVREGACSRNDVVQACSAGLHCGGCAPAIDEIIETESARGPANALLAMAELATG